MKENESEFSFDWSMLPFLLFWIVVLIGFVILFVYVGFPIPVDGLPATWTDNKKDTVSVIITIATYLFSGILYLLFFSLSVCMEAIFKTLKIMNSEGVDEQ